MNPKLDELRGRLDTLKTEITMLSEKDELTEEEEARFQPALDEFKATKEDFDKAEQRAAAIAEVRSTSTASKGYDAPNQTRDSFAVDPNHSSRSERRDAAMDVAAKQGTHLDTAQQKKVEKLLKSRGVDFDGDVIARKLITTETPAYHRAFAKMTSMPMPVFTQEETNALLEYRAANEGTSADGGFGIPILIDPTIILTSGAAAAPILDICTITTITTDAWKGVNSGGFTWAYDAESAAVADNSLTDLAQPVITVYKAAGFIPYTIEVGDDYPDFQEEMSKQLAQGYLNLVAKQTMTGSGSSQPFGIFTTLQNTTTPAHVIVTTLGTLGAVDVRSAYAKLGELFRSKATWMMNVSVENTIRAFGNNLALADFTINLGANGIGTLMGHDIRLSDYAPSPTNTTGAESFLVVGDFAHYRFIQRAGMTVELVPHLFDQSTARPLGQRGWYAWARHGADVDASNAFRLVSNT